jgi:elongation factor 2 kinase
VERFIAGKDSYGCGFVKHNTNSGYVDCDLRRTTPQVLSAFSFYASRGTRLVADVQGVGDLFTDPQVLSIDYRFGDGDLGPRGMALFFHSFRHCNLSDSMGIPIFPLSRNELKRQAKYDEDEITVSDEESTYSDDHKLDRFARLDLNRQYRRQSLNLPPKTLTFGDQLDQAPTQRRSNVMKSRAEESDSLRKSMQLNSSSSRFKRLNRSRSDVDEVSLCLKKATTDTRYDYHAFHRLPSGEVRERKRRSSEDEVNVNNSRGVRGTFIMARPAPMMVPDEQTKANIGKVHFHLACLHGLGRFPEDIPSFSTEGDSVADEHHDVFSVLFHLCHGASLYNVPACLSLARVKAGLDTTVSALLSTIVPIDFEGAKDLLRRAMESPHSPFEPKVAAGALLFQILHDEGTASPITMMAVLEDTLALEAEAKREAEANANHQAREARGGVHIGDKVEANYALEGTFYPGVIVEVSFDGKSVSVKYDDDDSVETLALEHVRHLVPTDAVPGDAAFALSDAEALGGENTDEKCILETYAMKAELADLKAAVGEKAKAAQLYEEAAEGAVVDGKMETATKWSLRAAELEG